MRRALRTGEAHTAIAIAPASCGAVRRPMAMRRAGPAAPCRPGSVGSGARRRPAGGPI